MESRYHVPDHVDESRPFLRFPLGTALLLIIIFTLSGVFSCCYHWDKLRSLHRSVSTDTDPEEDNNGPISKPKPTHMGTKQNQSESLPVLMPGDQIPKFIALPCPSRPPRPGNIVVQVQKPPKPPSIYIPVPLYF